MFSKSLGMGEVSSKQLRSRLTCSLLGLGASGRSMEDGKRVERAAMSIPIPVFLNHTRSREPLGHPSIPLAHIHTHTHTQSEVQLYPRAAQHRSIIMTNSNLLDTAGNITSVKYS